MANSLFCDPAFPPTLAKVDLELADKDHKGLEIEPSDAYKDSMAQGGKMAQAWTTATLMVPNSNVASAKIRANALQHQIGSVLECSNQEWTIHNQRPNLPLAKENSQKSSQRVAET